MDREERVICVDLCMVLEALDLMDTHELHELAVYWAKSRMDITWKRNKS